MQVVAILLVGSRPEPYLPAVLDGLVGGVDRLVVNDNSGLARSSNRDVIESSRLHNEGRVTIVEAPFEGFSRARNNCLDVIRADRSGDPPTWVLMVDADEVHGPRLATLTSRILPTLVASVGGVDGYVVQFMQTLDFFISIDRRHNLLFKLDSSVRYERDVHERLLGVNGRRLCLPYTYFHYGYVRPNQQILEKWVQYHGLGDRTYHKDAFPSEADPTMFLDQVPLCIPYVWKQPPALRAIDPAQLGPRDATLEFEQHVTAYLQHPWPRTRAWLRRLNYRLRLVQRLLESPIWLRNPLRWLDLARMTVSI